MEEASGVPVGCLVMAAGSARRFGSNKLCAFVDGAPLIEWALRSVPAERLAAVCVVTQYDLVEEYARRFGFACIRNDRPQDGVSRTIRLGVEALQQSCGAILFQVADQPHLRRASVEALLDFYLQKPECIAALSHDGVRGNPCLFPAAFFPELLSLTGDVGGSAVIRRHMERLRLLEVAGQELSDVDTPEAL